MVASARTKLNTECSYGCAARLFDGRGVTFNCSFFKAGGSVCVAIDNDTLCYIETEVLLKLAKDLAKALEDKHGGK